MAIRNPEHFRNRGERGSLKTWLAGFGAILISIGGATLLFVSWQAKLHNQMLPNGHGGLMGYKDGYRLSVGIFAIDFAWWWVAINGFMKPDGKIKDP